jgi:hypothetical protein
MDKLMDGWYVIANSLPKPDMVMVDVCNMRIGLVLEK